MRPLFDNASAFHDENAVRPAHGGESMSNHDRSALARQAIERLQHQPFAFGVERRSRLVE